MQLLSVNVGSAAQITIGTRSDVTGIFKQQTGAPVAIGALGLAGDVVANQKHHGGPDQAVYVYGDADYAWWRAELGRDLPPGTFGDNLTVSDLAAADLTIGDVLTVGAVRLQVTAPRIPCATLATRMGDPSFVKRFRAAERPGVYCRVLQTGRVQAGDPVTIAGYDGETLTVRAMFRLYYEADVSEADLRRQLAAPVAERARRDLEAKLAKRAQA